MPTRVRGRGRGWGRGVFLGGLRLGLVIGLDQTLIHSLSAGVLPTPI